jgi:peptidylprolyl isomerase/peptidyl-prolyl cis-trans isomerase D
MAILAQIRNRPIYLIMIIGLALFAFVVSGIFKGNGGPSRSNIGSVNGEEISNEQFSKLLEAQKNNKVSSIQAVKNVWNNVVREKVYEDALEKAGVVIGEKDIWDAMISNSGIQNDQRFKDESGLFDENKLKEYIATLKDNKDTPQGAQAWTGWVNYENSVKANLAQTTYNNLVKSGLTASLKEGERVYKNDNTSSDIEMVFVPYTTIKDDEVTVNDSEISSYINNHPKEYNVESNNEVAFIKFEVKPSQKDIDNVKNNIAKLINDHEDWNDAAGAKEKIEGFINAKDAKEFVRENSDTPFVDKLYLKKDLPNNVFDTLMTKSVGYVYGPYRDGDYFKLAKILSKDGEESVSSSHILIAYKGATRANEEVTRTREEAEKLAKEILKIVNKDNFADKAKEKSDGPSASKGGELGFYKQGQLAKEYNDFIFNKESKVGDIKLVETSFGFHIIKIDDKKTDPGLKLAIVTNKIDPSEETESKIYQNAESFALDLTNGKDITELAKEKNYKVQTANKIEELSENINGLGKQREIVKWTFDEATKIDNVKRFDLENGDYAVVQLKAKNPKGLMPLNEAKLKIAPKLKKEKKATQIHNKISGNTIEEMAKSVNLKVLSAKEMSIANANFKNGGKDVNVASALLYMNENDLKVIDGNNGVFIIKIIKKNQPYEIKNFNTYTNTINNKLKNKTSKVFDALKEGSEIEDNRTLFY